MNIPSEMQRRMNLFEQADIRSLRFENYKVTLQHDNPHQDMGMLTLILNTTKIFELQTSRLAGVYSSGGTNY
jgi:hypothetical protein